MDSFRAAAGRKLIGRDEAEELGTVDHLLLDIERGRIAALVVGRGRKARLVDWAEVRSFGPDAVIVPGADALRAPDGEREQAAAAGDLDVTGKRVLSTSGTDLGVVSDVTFDPADGCLDVLHVGQDTVPAGALRGIGSYAAVVDQGPPSPAS